ncbi:MAG: DNA alkylation repair protein [Bacteroidales bacterium]|nr:DNA alkylation repair protein [Bacteroidales bacterium]
MSKSIIEEIREKLFGLEDKKYAEFQRKLIPNIPPQTIIGTRTPRVKAYAKQMIKREDIGLFLNDLPHKYFDENQLHVFLLSLMKDFDECMEEVEKFLPYINNWATSDQLSPKCFKKNKKELLKRINHWLRSKKEYTLRFAIGMLLQHFLEEDFKEQHLYKVAKIQREEYYIKMMQAWYYSTALVKQYETTLNFLQQNLLDKWLHNKSIQKAVESYRITDEQKEFLKTLKQK